MIKCESLSKRYGKDKALALDRLDLEVGSNSIFGFLGPNGAGKTTTIRILTGLMGQTSGSALVAGEVVGKNNISLRRKIGYLGQEPRMYKWMRGKELLQFVGEIFGMQKRERKVRADELLEMAGLSNAANKRISAYSGGMLQRLGIAQAMVSRPQVLLLDEPTSALDPIGRKEVLDFIASLRNDCTVFMSTHILADVERVCDTVGIIHKGKLIAGGNTADLRKKYAPHNIEIELSDAARRQELLSFLSGLDLPARISDNDQVISVRPVNPEAAAVQILGYISGQGIALTRFELVNATLEDVFVKLVGGGHE